MRVEKRVDGVIICKFTAVDDIVVVMDMGGGDVVVVVVERLACTVCTL